MWIQEVATKKRINVKLNVRILLKRKWSWPSWSWKSCCYLTSPFWASCIYQTNFQVKLFCKTLLKMKLTCVSIKALLRLMQNLKILISFLMPTWLIIDVGNFYFVSEAPKFENLFFLFFEHSSQIFWFQCFGLYFWT